ncbi:MAG: ATP-binding protein [Planctomycetaceae bacterium]
MHRSSPNRDSLLLRLLRAPWRVLALVLLVVFAVETAVMSLLPSLLPKTVSDTAAAMIDATLLTAISAPALWWILIGPLRRIALEAQALSSTIVEDAGDGIITVNAAGRVQSFNPAAQEIFERPVEEVLGHPVTELLPDIELSATRLGEAVSIEGRRSSGREFPASVSIRTLGNEEDSARVIVIRDLTQARRAEEERTRAVREQEALRAQQMATLAQLATGVAHEIRNPLTAIKMLVQSSESDGQQPSLSGEDLRIVETQIRRMEGSVSALLDFARPAPTERRHLQIGDVLPDVIRLLAGQAGKQQVELRVEGDSLQAELNADRDQLQRLLLNLGLNALNAMPLGGVLTFSVTNDHPDRLCVHVTDTGPGIPPDIIVDIFEPFFTTRKQGVGLGLNICRRIATEHGGTLTADNLPSGGADFEVCLPILTSLKPEAV